MLTTDMQQQEYTQRETYALFNTSLMFSFDHFIAKSLFKFIF